MVDVAPTWPSSAWSGHRGMAEADARARMARQVSREERLAKADFVIDNCGTPEDLDEAVERAWAWIATLPDEAPPEA